MIKNIISQFTRQLLSASEIIILVPAAKKTGFTTAFITVEGH
jgi:hypothetical protein